jgi:hypothetical protein
MWKLLRNLLLFLLPTLIGLGLTYEADATFVSSPAHQTCKGHFVGSNSDLGAGPYSWASQAIGPDIPKMVVVVGYMFDSNPISAADITLDGADGTNVFQSSFSTSGSAPVIASFQVSGGTTATVAMAAGEGQDEAAIDVYYFTGNCVMGEVYYATGSAGTSVSASSVVQALAPSAVLAAASHNDATNIVTGTVWTNATEVTDGITSGSSWGSALDHYTAPVASRTITSTPTLGNESHAMVIVTWYTRPPTLYPVTCQSSTTDLTTYDFNNVTTGVDDRDGFMPVVGVISEDGATVFGVNSVSVDGVSITQVVDEDGTGLISTAIFANFNGNAQTGLASVNIQVTHSEAVQAAVACLWLLPFDAMVVSTAAQSATDDDTASAAVTMTPGKASGDGLARAVVGVCGNTGVADSTTWAAARMAQAQTIFELEDTQNAEFDYSAMQFRQWFVNGGETLSITCDWTGANDASGSVATFR